MGIATFKKETGTPSTPSSGYAKLYVEGTALKYVDDTGIVYTIATGLTQEDVHDIVAGLITNSASITWNYNDPSNILTATVAASGVNHNALQNYIANQHIDHSSVSITAGTGLSGGGDITTSRTLNLANTAVTPNSYGSASSVGTFTVDAQGRLTAAASSAIAITSSAVSDFSEAAQDAVGASLTDTASVDFTYSDAGNTISAVVLPGGVDHNSLQNYAANRHIDHTTVSISAGTGLTGGGDITTSRTLNLANTAVVAGVYGTTSAVPTITVDAQGRITNAGNTSISVTSSAVSDFSEAVDDRVSALVVAGSGISATYNDVTNTLTIASTITQYTDEQAQDAVGNALLDSASIDFQYPDVSNQITAVVLPAGVNHDALQNFVANEHIDHSAVSISAGTGLSGGGDITANRTLNIANTGVTAGSYGSAAAIPVLTINAQGQVTSASTVGNPASAGVQSLKTTGPLNTGSNAALSNISELQFSVTSGFTYKIEAYILYRAAATTTGIALSLGNTSAAGTLAVMIQAQVAADATSALYTGHITGFGDTVVTSGVQATGVDYIAKYEGLFVCSTSGTIVPQFRSEVNGSQVTVQAGSVILVREY
jgi:hypothetical protein